MHNNFSEPIDFMVGSRKLSELVSGPVSEHKESVADTRFKIETLSNKCAQGAPPRIIRRFTPDGKPSVGDPSKIENNFSITDPSGLRYDFRYGARLFVPPTLDGVFDVEFSDAVTGFVHFRTCLKAGESVFSSKRWFVPWRIIAKKEGQVVFDHTLNLKGKEVCIHIPTGGLGDTIAWFSYAEPFMLKHDCRLTVAIDPERSKLFRKQYPSLGWGNEASWQNTPFYAVYHMGIYSPDNENDAQPEDFRLKGLHHNAAAILGLDEEDVPPRIGVNWSPVEPKYACIATRASARCKEWLNPAGWPALIAWLNDQGYKVIDIDKEFLRGYDTIPYGAENLTGSIDLLERAKTIAGASFFIGVSSGLTWLAWCTGVPIVLISGWTLPYTEFNTPYRVINRQVCHGCWNDLREQFDHFDSNYCPRHKDSLREHECSKAISADQVIRTIKTIPSYGR